MKKESMIFACMLALIIAFAGCASITIRAGKYSPSQSVSSQSIKPQNDSEWVVYTDADNKLHKSKADGTEDEIILNEAVLTPCKADEWVYYFANLDEIDKIKMDGSQQTKVCDTSAMQALNANSAITAEYKDGYIRYKLIQLREVGDESPNTVTYYRLDIKQGKITLADS